MHYAAASLFAGLTLASAGWAVLQLPPETLTGLGIVARPDADGEKRGTAPSLPPLTGAHGSVQEDGAPPFDVARIAPDGTSVFAGRARPDAFVTVLADGVPIGTAKADASGEWVLITDHRLPNADPALSIRIETAAADTRVEAASADLRMAPRTPRPTAASVTAHLMDDLQRRVDAARASIASRAAGASPAADVHGVTSPDDRTPDAPRSTTNDDTTTGKRVIVAAGQTAAVGAAGAGQVVPVPIQFVFREAEFTEGGRKAVQLLLDYVRLANLPALRLTGHADERGTQAFNLNLSAERLEAVARFLRAGGYGGKLELIPKGDTEPYMGVDRRLFPREQLYDLDRRVELHLN